MIIIPKALSRKIVMTGAYYKENHPGGISAVVRYWSDYFEDIQYYPIFREGSTLNKISVFVKSFFSLRKKLSSDKDVRILHAHTAAGADLTRTAIMVNLAKKKGLKVIIHSHASRFKDYYGEVSDKKRVWIKEVLQKADILIVLSKSWKAFFVSIGIPENKIIVLHNITAYPSFIDVEKRDGILRLLFLGEIGQRKGVFDLLRAIGNHRNELENKIELRIGGNKMEEKLRATIADYGLEGFVHFEGFVTGEKKQKLLNWANVFVLPSFNEGLPISILEAMSYGMPIISTPVGGIPEIVDDSNGILVTPGNDVQIYEAIKKYLSNPDLLTQQGLVSRRIVEEYLPGFVMRELKMLYEGLIDELDGNN